jgi:hypothetical protein
LVKKDMRYRAHPNRVLLSNWFSKHSPSQISLLFQKVRYPCPLQKELDFGFVCFVMYNIKISSNVPIAHLYLIFAMAGTYPSPSWSGLPTDILFTILRRLELLMDG